MSKNKMTKEEFEEEYSDVELHFNSYYKYSFTFKGVAEDGAEITASFGGNHHDIYRYELYAENTKKVSNNIEMIWHYLRAKKDGEEIFEYWDNW